MLSGRASLVGVVVCTAAVGVVVFGGCCSCIICDSSKWSEVFPVVVVVAVTPVVSGFGFESPPPVVSNADWSGITTGVAVLFD